VTISSIGVPVFSFDVTGPVLMVVCSQPAASSATIAKVLNKMMNLMATLLEQGRATK
jgi:hypothetical protein